MGACPEEQHVARLIPVRRAPRVGEARALAHAVPYGHRRRGGVDAVLGGCPTGALRHVVLTRTFFGGPEHEEGVALGDKPGRGKGGGREE